MALQSAIDNTTTFWVLGTAPSGASAKRQTGNPVESSTPDGRARVLDEETQVEEVFGRLAERVLCVVVHEQRHHASTKDPARSPSSDFSSAGLGSIEDERIFAAMTSFKRCSRRFVASSRCVGMDRRYDSVPLIGRKVTLRATEARAFGGRTPRCRS